MRLIGKVVREELLSESIPEHLNSLKSDMSISTVKKVLSQSKALHFLCILLLFADWSFGQTNLVRVNLPKDYSNTYKSELCNYLFPKVDTLIDKVVVLFFVMPINNPEYSIRIIDRENQSFIEARFLEKSLWNELFQHLIRKDVNPLLLNVNFFSVPISTQFKEKMLIAFTNVIHNKKISNEIPVDGTSYEFWIFDQNARVRSLEVNSPEYGTIEDSMAGLCARMSNDLRNSSFEESKYIDQLK